MTNMQESTTVEHDDTTLKNPVRTGIILGTGVVIVAIVVVLLMYCTPAAHGDTDLRSELMVNSVSYSTADIDNAFSDYGHAITDRVVNWSAVNGGLSNPQNIATMAQLQRIMPWAMVEGQAAELVEFWKHNPSGIEVSSPDREGCLIGALMRGYMIRNNFAPTQLAQDEFNGLQALILIHTDPLHFGESVEQGHEFILKHAETYPPAVAGFGDPFLGTGGLGLGYTACGIQQQELQLS